MKRFELVLLAGLVASSAMAQEADSVSPITTAEEACKLAYAWTGFDKNRPADLIPKCRAELVDSGYLKQPDLKDRIKGEQLWKVSFDTIQVARMGTSDSILRKQRPKRCQVFLNAIDARLIVVTIYELGRDTSNVPVPEKRDLDLANDSFVVAPTVIDMLGALSKALCQPFRSRLVECVCVQGFGQGSELKGPYWRIISHAVESNRLTLSGRFSGRQTTCIDATDGKFRCGLDVSGEGHFLPDESDIRRLALEWTGFQDKCFEGTASACRVTRASSTSLDRIGWPRSAGGDDVWVATFDSVVVPGTRDGRSSQRRSQPLRCELLFDSRTERLLMVKIMEVTFDSTEVAPPASRCFSLDSGFLTNDPMGPSLYCLLQNEQCRHLCQSGILEATMVKKVKTFPVEYAYWIFIRHGKVMIPHRGLEIGGELMRYDHAQNKLERIGSPWTEEMPRAYRRPGKIKAPTP